MRTTCLLSGFVAVLLLGSTIPALAQPPPTTTGPAPTPPTPPAGSARTPGNAGSDSVERAGPFVTASLGIPGVDLQLGWTLAPWMAMFASFGGYAGGNLILPNGKVQPADVGFQAGGVRLGSGVGFGEAQVASLTATNACEFDDPCIHRHSLAVILGAGLEIVHTQHFGLHLRTQFIIDRYDVVPFLQIGLGFYL